MTLTTLVIRLTVTILLGGIMAKAQTDPVARCYKFTWLGPRYTNESVFHNATCAEATRLSRGVPCMHPLVVSYDGTWPDVEYIWTHHSRQASCILAPNDVCAQYTYYFNGFASNSTYICTRAIDTEGKAITSGCYEQRNESSTIRICFCRSVPGGVPCNDATAVFPFINYSISIIVLLRFQLLLFYSI